MRYPSRSMLRVAEPSARIRRVACSLYRPALPSSGLLLCFALLLPMWLQMWSAAPCVAQESSPDPAASSAAASSPAAKTPGKAQTASADAVTWIVGATVIPMDRPGSLPDLAVRVRGQQIDALVPQSEAKPGPGERVIRAEGKYLLPGLADMHVHSNSEADLWLLAAHGVTTARVLWGTPWHLGWQRQIEAGERIAPDLVVAGPIIDGKPAIWPGSLAIDDVDEVREAVRLQQRAGYHQIKLYEKLSEEVFAAAVEEARAQGMLSTGHVPRALSLGRALELGLDAIEHLTGYRRALQRVSSPLAGLSAGELAAMDPAKRRKLLLENTDLTRLPEVVELTRKHGVWNTPTLIVLRNSVATAERKAQLARDPRMRYIPAFTRNWWKPENDFRFKDASEERMRLEEQGLADLMAVVRALHAGGCPLLLGTDTPNPYVFPGSSVHEELALMVEAGLSPWHALATGTVAPARFLDRVGKQGVIAAGARADLLLLEADPLANIANTERIAAVMVRGRWLARGDLDALLEKAATAANGSSSP